MQNRNFSGFSLGILGGGQLGRMLIQAAIDLDLKIGVLDPDPMAPCKNWVSDFYRGNLRDFQTVLDFGRRYDGLTIEIENVNADALEALSDMGKMVYPRADFIRTIQNKREQKELYKRLGLPSAQFVSVPDRTALQQLKLQLPLVQKLEREGYDGRGVKILRTEADLDNAFDSPSIVETCVDMDKELSVLIARNKSGQVAVYPVAEMVFHPVYNLVEYLICPASIPHRTADEAVRIARTLVEETNFIGLLAVEMFLDTSGRLLINEVAPRPHNSGHHTIKACATSQYEQHLRAILDLPLGSTELLAHTAMVNLLGAPDNIGKPLYRGLQEIMSLPGVYPHIYGKAETKPFRKMGHITLIDKNPDRLVSTLKYVRETVSVTSGS